MQLPPQEQLVSTTGSHDVQIGVQQLRETLQRRCAY